jgi:hypothetical protein
MQELDRRRRRLCRNGVRIAAGLSDSKAKLRTDTMAGGKHGVIESRRKPWRRAGSTSRRNRTFQRLFDPLGSLHRPASVILD